MLETPVLFLGDFRLMKKRHLTLVTLPLLTLSTLTGCSKKADYNIGIIQWVEIDALTRATKGFISAVKEGLGSNKVDFEVKNAYGENSAASSMINSFVNKRKNLIMANATPSVIAAANATDSIPIVGTSVTTYEGAFDERIPSNVTGTSDLADLSAQAQMIFDWFPSASTIGILYCESESNSKFQSSEISKAILTIKPTAKIEVITFTQTDDMVLRLNAKKNNLDVLYIPTDNTCANNASSIHDTISDVNLPIIAGEEGICKVCGLATLTIDYYRLGRITGEMAVEILKEGKSPKDMAIRYDEQQEKLYNPEILAELGLTETDVPEGYRPIGE